MRSQHNRSRQARVRQRKGAVMVEGTLVFLSLLSMMLFILDMGRILLIGQYTTERARAAARAATVNNWNKTKVQKFLVFNNPDVSDDHLSKAGFLGVRTSNVDYQTLGTAGKPDYRVQVIVSNIQAVMFVPYIAGKYTLPQVKVTMPAQSMGATN